MPLFTYGSNGSGNSGGGNNGVSNHELLTGLLGGDTDGHYHLTREEYRKFLELISKPSDTHENVYDGEFPYTPETDYTETLEGGNPNTQTWNVTGGGDP